MQIETALPWLDPASRYGIVDIRLMNDLRDELRPGVYQARIGHRDLCSRYGILESIFCQQPQERKDTPHQITDQQKAEDQEQDETSTHDGIRRRRL